MQKLKQRTEKNTPTNTPQVRGNCGLSLNREETLSVTSSKTYFNNPEVDLPSHTKGFKSKVYVLSIDGTPLMPCKPAKGRKLLKNKKAKIVKLYPFTIQLTFECENKVQDVILGVDSGYKNIGFSCVTEKEELISGTLILDDKTSSRLTEKKMYRRGRRSRHHWYRKPRFLNRKKKEGWLPPSIQRRYNTHLTLIKKIKSILPVTQIIIETANFDIQKIKNPEIEGVEYQQGDMFGYQNLRSYLMSREGGCCQLCKKEFKKGDPSHIHHCKTRSEQGSNSPKNLAILHKKCHENLHKKGLKLKPAKEYKSNAFMSIIHKMFYIDVPNLKVTYGYITFIKRNELKIEKTHYNDAFVIANGSIQNRISPIIIKQKHRNNRVLQLNGKGYKPSIRKQRYSIQPKDLIWVDGKKHVVIGISGYGKQVKIENFKKLLSTKKIEKVYNFGGFAYGN